jgi:hypothetical protein
MCTARIATTTTVAEAVEVEEEAPLAEVVAEAAEKPAAKKKAAAKKVEPEAAEAKAAKPTAKKAKKAEA